MNIAILIYLQDTKMLGGILHGEGFFEQVGFEGGLKEKYMFYSRHAKTSILRKCLKRLAFPVNPWSDRAFLEMPKNCSHICICSEHFQQMTYVQLLCMFYRHTTTSCIQCTIPA